jgi:hypothetical protein
LDTVTVLGVPEAATSPHFAARLAAVSFPSSPEQSFVAAPTFEDGVLHGYDMKGRIVERWGGPGEGPGEFSGQGFAALRGFGSRLWVAAQAEPRVSILEAGADPVTFTLPWPLVDFFPTSDSTAIGLPMADGIGPVRFATSGEVFPISLPEGLWASDRGGGLTGSPSGGILAFHPDGVLLELNPSGGLVDTMALPDTLTVQGEDVAPPRLTGVGEADGVLWVHVTRTVERPTRGMAFGPGAADQLMDSRFAALDGETFDVIAVLNAPEAMMPVYSSSGLELAHVIETELGDTRLQIVRPVLEAGGAR